MIFSYDPSAFIATVRNNAEDNRSLMHRIFLPSVEYTGSVFKARVSEPGHTPLPSIFVLKMLPGLGVFW
jgi:hypothetical protein